MANKTFRDEDMTTMKNADEEKQRSMVVAIKRYFDFCNSNGLVVDVGVIHNIVDAYDKSIRYDRTPTGSICVFSWALEETLKEWEQPDWLKLVLEGVGNFEDFTKVTKGLKEWIKKSEKESDHDTMTNPDDPDAKVSHEYDMVNKPPHYNREGAMETIDEMVLVFGRKETMAYCKLNAWKYRARALMKNGLEDLKKSDWYLKKYKELSDTVTCYMPSYKINKELSDTIVHKTSPITYYQPSYKINKDALKDFITPTADKK